LYAGRYQIECENSFEMVDVRRLIDDVNLPTQELYQELQTPVTPLQSELDNQKKESFNVINNIQLKLESNSMSESYQSKYDQRNANNQFVDTAQAGSNVTFNQNNYTPEQKQNLADAAAEIQQLIHQLSKNNQTSTNEVITKAIHQEIQRNPTLKARLISALKAGGLEALKAIFNHPVFSIPAETIKGFLEAE
jgi:translation elongation factor EF-G